jgi:hypothetical protein
MVPCSGPDLDFVGATDSQALGAAATGLGHRRKRYSNAWPVREGVGALVGTDNQGRLGSGEDTSIRCASTHRGRLLEVDLRELRATWLMHGTTPDIVLYDGISGRAGYARRIGEISRCVACSKVCSTI